MSRESLPGTGLDESKLELSSEYLPTLGNWTPSMDVSETGDCLIARLEVPGMDPQDIHISLRENVLTLQGEKIADQHGPAEHFHRVERAYGSFIRTVRLPVAVDPRAVTARSKNGLLTVTLPKTPPMTDIPIRIQAE